MLLGIAQGVDLSSSVNLLSILSSCSSNPNTNIPLIIASGPMPSSLTLHRSFTPSFSHHHHPHRVHRFIKPICDPFLFPTKPPRFPIVSFSSTFVEHLSSETIQAEEDEEIWDFNNVAESERFDLGTSDMRRMEVPELEIKELDELPEQWRRTKLAWLCKQLPSHKPKTLVRLLKAQKKWMRQEDATYVLVHCLRIRENDSAFWVHKWMMQQHWYRFDFALSTKLADYLGKERKFLKCREIFDDIINQGRVPSESTFHILVVAYLSASVKGCLEEACSVYNRMIQLGGYQPQLSLHNSLFRSILNKPGSFAKHYLKQAEFIFHNVLTSGFEIHKDIYSGLIWLHSCQDNVDKERIAALRKEMQQAGFQEGKEVFVSVLRACMEGGDVEEAESMWSKLLCLDGGFPSQAAVYMMEVYAKAGDHRKSLEIFRDMEERLCSNNVAAYHKVIEILCKAQEIELAESVMDAFINSGLKPCMPAYISVMNMYFNLNLHDRVELAFSQCLERCRPSCTVYSIYLDSLVKVGKVDKAGEIFNEMLRNEAVGINARSCNIILSGYLSSEDYKKAEGVYDLMCQKKYDIESLLMEKVEYVLSLSKKEVKKLVSFKLSKEQREMLVGLLLGGLQIVTDEEKKSHMICFEFSESSSTHSCLKRHIYNQYHEWLHPLYKSNDDCESIPDRFATISHSYFGFYADQFCPKGRLVIPNLIHRWLSPRALAYWYMYGGYKTSSGDILLKVKGSRDGVEKIVKSLKARSLDCRVKHKGKVFWIGFLGSKSTLFWKLVEPYVLDDLKDDLNAGNEITSDSTSKYEDIAFNSGSDTD